MESLLKFDFKTGRKMQVYQFPLCSTYTSYLEAIEQQGLKDTDTLAPELSFGDPYSALEDSFAFTSALSTELTTRELIKLRDCRAILTPSIHSHTVLSASRLGVPIARVRYGVDTAKYALRTVSPKCCTFGFVNAEGTRSEANVKLVIDAFNRAFAGVQNVRLQIRRSNYIAPDIRISVGGAPDSEWYPWLTALIVIPQARNVCDEALKAMARGVPVITSNYGFSAEYYDSLHCYPLDWELKEQPDGYWAETCVEALAVQMRAVYDDQEQAEAKGLLASEAMQVFDWKYVLPELVQNLNKLNFWKNESIKSKPFWFPNVISAPPEVDHYDVASEVARYTEIRPDPPVSSYDEIHSYGTIVTSGCEKEALVALKSLELYTDKPIFAICDKVSASYLKENGVKANLIIGFTPDILHEYRFRFFSTLSRYVKSDNKYTPEGYAAMLKKSDVLYYGVKNYGNCLYFDADFVFTGSYTGINLAPVVLSKHYWKFGAPRLYINDSLFGRYNAGHVFCAESSFAQIWSNNYVKRGLFIDQDSLDYLPKDTPVFSRHVAAGFWMIDSVKESKVKCPNWNLVSQILELPPLSSDVNNSPISFHVHLCRFDDWDASTIFKRYLRWSLSNSDEPTHKRVLNMIDHFVK